MQRRRTTGLPRATGRSAARYQHPAREADDRGSVNNQQGRLNTHSTHIVPTVHCLANLPCQWATSVTGVPDTTPMTVGWRSMTLNSTSMARPPSAANNSTTGHARAGSVKHQVKPLWQRSVGVGHE
jgi:hypothetical protein